MQFWRDAIKGWLLRRDIIISRPPGQFDVGHVKWKKVRDRGLKVNVALDGGAHIGWWASEFKQIYPQAQVVMAEPREQEQPELRATAARVPGLFVAQTLLGPREGTMEMNEHTAQSSVLSNSQGKSFGKVVPHPMTTIDRLFESLKLPYPDLIKLDLQGYELEALKGAEKSLAHAEAVMLEVSMIEFQKGQPIAAEVVAFMDGAGFQFYDIFALSHRALDGALAQGDFLFVKKTSGLVSDHRWSATASWT